MTVYGHMAVIIDPVFASEPKANASQKDRLAKPVPLLTFFCAVAQENQSSCVYTEFIFFEF